MRENLAMAAKELIILLTAFAKVANVKRISAVFA